MTFGRREGALARFSSSFMINAPSAPPIVRRRGRGERVRRSSLVDWPVYPRLAHTMRASNDAQCGADELSQRGLVRGVGGGSRRVFRFRTASCDFIRHAEEAVSPPASF